MKFLLSIITFAVILTSISCSDDNTKQPEIPTVFSSGFIQEYTEPTELTVFANPVWPANFIGLEFMGNNITEKNEVEYMQYSERYHDTNYNDYLPELQNSTLVHKLSNIIITCDVDLWGTHPAGTPLNDKVMFYASSPKEFILSGYTMKTEPFFGMFKFLFVNSYPGNSPIYKPLTELTEEDLTLINTCCYLEITGPIYVGRYLFTVTVDIPETGLKLSDSIEYIRKV